jgi:hypothetical protein
VVAAAIRCSAGLSWAVRLAAAALAALIGSAGVEAQAPRPAAQQAVGQGDPIDQITVDKLVWSTVVALDQANRTGNYSVLRDLAAPTFQDKNSAATLAGIFEPFRSRHIDLSNVVIVSPVYEQRPVVQGGALRAKGIFPVRPNPIGFDLLFQSISGEWRLLGISVVPLVAVKR